MKRFWKTASVASGDGGSWVIRLDDKPVKTPGRNVLAVPTPTLAGSIAGEWNAQGADVDLHTMPHTGLANAAIDRVAPDPATFRTDLARYAESDVLCYRAGEPPELAALQAEVWDPLLAWARARFDIHFELVTGIMHRQQPEATVARLGAALRSCDAFQLAAMSPLVTISGSLISALAVLEGHIDADAAFAAAHLDELWQVERWGEDHLAAEARAIRLRDFQAAAAFLGLL